MYSEQKQALAAELNFKHPSVLAVSGAKGCGKTTLLAALLPVPAALRMTSILGQPLSLKPSSSTRS